MSRPMREPLGAGADRHALVHEHAQERAPTVVLVADEGVGGEADVVEEHLVELGGAGHLAAAGRIVTPSSFKSTMNIDNPLCLGTSGFVRAIITA